MRFYLLLLLVITFQFAQSQLIRTFDFEPWYGLLTSVRVAKRFSIWNDAHFVNQTFIIVRTGLTFHPKSDNFVTTVGYSRLGLTAPWSEGRLVRPENRPWMQTIYRVPSKQKLSTSFRFRYDGRFIRDLTPDGLASTYSFNHRWRFNNTLKYNFGNIISSKTLFFATLLNESFITSGPGPNGAPFEHRTHMLGQLNSGDFTYSLGYIVRYVNVNPNLSRLNHGPVLWLSLNLNLMKKNKETFVEFPEDHAD